MKRITSKTELEALAQKLGVRPDWHEPDEQEVTAEVRGVSFDNAGTWGPGFDPSTYPNIEEMHVVLTQDGENVACVNLATLFAWATGYES
jgi:hypothetical protein